MRLCTDGRSDRDPERASVVRAQRNACISDRGRDIPREKGRPGSELEPSACSWDGTALRDRLEREPGAVCRYDRRRTAPVLRAVWPGNKARAGQTTARGVL